MTEFIYVAGVDYPVYHHHPETSKTQFQKRPYTNKFRDFCLRRAHKTATTSKMTDARFTLFDFFSGSQEEIVFDKRGKPAFNVLKTLGVFDESDYRRNDAPRTTNATLTSVVNQEALSFKTPPDPEPRIFFFPGVSAVSRSGPVSESAYRQYYAAGAHAIPAVMSIVDVYKYIIDAGATRPRTISELHFFSHAVADGPILGNSLDFNSNGSARDPLDVDARVKDFSPDSLIGKAGKQFSEAFALDARTFIWGCEAFTVLRNLLNQLLQQARKVKNENDAKIVFDWSEAWKIPLTDFHALLAGDATSKKSKRWSIREIHDLIGEFLVQHLYAQQFANASQREVLAALPATYAEFDTRGATDDRLLHIPMGAQFGDKQDFRSILNFYGKQFTFDFDTKAGYSPIYGRGYAFYYPGREYTGKAGAIPPQTTGEQPV